MTDQRRSHDDLPIDFSVLDPATDSVRYDRVLRAVAERAHEELAKRRAHQSPLVQMARWRRHTMAAAITIAAASILTLVRVQPANPAATARSHEGGLRAQVATAMGVPSPIARSFDRRTWPAIAELLYATESTR